ncbi:MAG: hypothetical protein ACLQIB_21375 [Isosphaeraceae bacterium]
MADTSVTEVDIDITFRQQVVVTAFSASGQQVGSTRGPERDLVREILMKTLQAVQGSRRSITLNVDNSGTIQRDPTFPVDPVASAATTSSRALPSGRARKSTTLKPERTTTKPKKTTTKPKKRTGKPPKTTRKPKKTTPKPEG